MDWGNYVREKKPPEEMVIQVIEGTTSDWPAFIETQKKSSKAHIKHNMCKD